MILKMIIWKHNIPKKGLIFVDPSYLPCCVVVVDIQVVVVDFVVSVICPSIIFIYVNYDIKFDRLLSQKVTI